MPYNCLYLKYKASIFYYLFKTETKSLFEAVSKVTVKKPVNKGIYDVIQDENVVKKVKHRIKQFIFVKKEISVHTV